MVEGKAGSGHPLPSSEEAREELVPEHLVREKGRGEDETKSSQPQDGLTAPDGRRYRGDR